MHGYYVDCQITDPDEPLASLRSDKWVGLHVNLLNWWLVTPSIELHRRRHRHYRTSGVGGDEGTPWFQGRLLWLTEDSCLMIMPAMHQHGVYQRVSCLRKLKDVNATHWLEWPEVHFPEPLTQDSYLVASLPGVKYGAVELI